MNPLTPYEQLSKLAADLFVRSQLHPALLPDDLAHLKKARSDLEHIERADFDARAEARRKELERVA